MSGPSPPIQRMENISKRFGRVVPNAAASIAVSEGEIFALVGENSAGKSVLMKILCGVLGQMPERIVFRVSHLSWGPCRSNPTSYRHGAPAFHART